MKQSTFNIINGDYDQEEKIEKINDIKNAIQSGDVEPTILHTDEGVYYQMSWKDANGSHNYILEEQVSPNQAYLDNSLTEYVSDLIGGHKGERLKAIFAMRGINVYSGQNIAGSLPSKLVPVDPKTGDRMNYVSFDADNHGTYLYLGEDEENKFPYSYEKYIIDNSPNNNPNMGIEEFRSIINGINTDLDKVFTPDDIAEIMELGGISVEMENKIRNRYSKLKKPYPFKDPVHAITYAN